MIKLAKSFFLSVLFLAFVGVNVSAEGIEMQQFSALHNSDDWLLVDKINTGDSCEPVISSYRTAGERCNGTCKVCITNNGTNPLTYCYKTVDCAEDNLVEGTVEAGGQKEFIAKKSTLQQSLMLQGKNGTALIYEENSGMLVAGIAVAELKKGQTSATKVFELGPASDDAPIIIGKYDNDDEEYNHSLGIVNRGYEDVMFTLKQGRKKIASGVVPSQSEKVLYHIHMNSNSTETCTLKLESIETKGWGFPCCSPRPRASAKAVLHEMVPPPIQVTE